MPRCLVPRLQSAAPHCRHYAWHHAQLSRPRGTPAAGKRISLGISSDQRDGECSGPGCGHGTVPVTILGLLRGAVAHGLPGSAVACPGTRSSYARNVHTHGWPPARPCRGTSLILGLPGAPVFPLASDGVGAVLQAQQPPAGRSIILQNIATLGQDEANQGMGKQPWGFMGTPSPPGRAGGLQHPMVGHSGKLPPGMAARLPTVTLPKSPQPSHLCGNSPSFFTSQKGPGIADQGPLPSQCCNPRLSRESGKLRQPLGFLGIKPSSQQQ